MFGATTVAVVFDAAAVAGEHIWQMQSLFAVVEAFPAVLACILPDGKRVDAENVVPKPHQHLPTR